MSRFAKGPFAALSLVGVFAAAVLVGGITLAHPEDKPAARAADQKPEAKLAVDPKEVRVGPPPELAELREAVELAARKGENVDDIRKQLDALEKALAGKSWTKPKPAPADEALPAPGNNGRFQAQPGLGGLGADIDAAARALERLQKIEEDLRKNPNDPVAIQNAIVEYQKLMLEAAGAMGANPLAGGQAFGLGMNRGLARQNDARFGVRLEKPSPALIEQLDLPAGKGLLVIDVINGMPADRAGVKVNDILLEFGGKPVPDNIFDFVQIVNSAKTDAKLDAVVLRKGKKEAIKGIELPELRRGGFGRVRAGGVIMPGFPGGANVAAMSVSVSNGQFTITSTQDGVRYNIEGDSTTGKPNKIKIQEGDETIEAASLDKVPEKYKARVEKMLGGVKVRE